MELKTNWGSMNVDEPVLPREYQLLVNFGDAAQLHYDQSAKFASILYFKTNYLGHLWNP